MPMMPSSALGARRQQLSETKAAERYLCFGQFRVDLQREELFKEESRVRIPSKVFQVLLALVERPGEIVTREALRARLWPGGTSPRTARGSRRRPAPPAGPTPGPPAGRPSPTWTAGPRPASRCLGTR